jgi:hypothetical protein
MQSACGSSGNRQICASSSECPPAYPVCRAGGSQMTCHAAFDAGSSGGGGDAAGAPDAQPVDAASAG